MAPSNSIFTSFNIITKVHRSLLYYTAFKRCIWHCVWPWCSWFPLSVPASAFGLDNACISILFLLFDILIDNDTICTYFFLFILFCCWWVLLGLVSNSTAQWGCRTGLSCLFLPLDLTIWMIPTSRSGFASYQSTSLSIHIFAIVPSTIVYQF